MPIVIKQIQTQNGKMRMRFGDKTTIYFDGGRAEVERFIARRKEDKLMRLALQWVLDQVDAGAVITSIENKRFSMQPILVEDI